MRGESCALTVPSIQLRIVRSGDHEIRRNGRASRHPHPVADAGRSDPSGGHMAGQRLEAAVVRVIAAPSSNGPALGRSRSMALSRFGSADLGDYEPGNRRNVNTTHVIMMNDMDVLVTRGSTRVLEPLQPSPTCYPVRVDSSNCSAAACRVVCPRLPHARLHAGTNAQVTWRASRELVERVRAAFSWCPS